MNAPDPREAIDDLNRHGACVSYQPAFLSAPEAAGFLRALLEEIEFDRPEDCRVRVHGRWRDIPRRQAAYGDPGARYRFAGCTVPARPWTPILARLRDLVRERAEFAANFVLVNSYRDGRDCIGWHSDDEADLGPAPQILSLSLGAPRDFQFRRRDAAAGRLETVTLALQPGSLLVMRDPTNKLWKHQVPRRGGRHPERVGPRLNLTWRQILASDPTTPRFGGPSTPSAP
jgi:alpha-ketoglutarate-dependent dioxygenase alkB family protein 2